MKEGRGERKEVGLLRKRIVHIVVSVRAAIVVFYLCGRIDTSDNGS